MPSIHTALWNRNTFFAFRCIHVSFSCIHVAEWILWLPPTTIVNPWPPVYCIGCILLQGLLSEISFETDNVFRKWAKVLLRCYIGNANKQLRSDTIKQLLILTAWFLTWAMESYKTVDLYLNPQYKIDISLGSGTVPIVVMITTFCPKGPGF